MLHAYLKYPNSRVSVHALPTCALVRSHKKKGQRVVRIDSASLSDELKRFKEREYRFASTAELNDLWLVVDLGDLDLEGAVIKHVHRQPSKQYKPFRGATLETHCSAAGAA